MCFRRGAAGGEAQQPGAATGFGLCIQRVDQHFLMDAAVVAPRDEAIRKVERGEELVVAGHL